MSFCHFLFIEHVRTEQDWFYDVKLSRKWQKCFPANLCFVQAEVLVYWYDTNQFYHFPTWPHRHWHWPVYPWQWPDPDTVATTGDLTHTTASRMVTFNTYHKGESAKIYETLIWLAFLLVLAQSTFECIPKLRYPKPKSFWSPFRIITLSPSTRYHTPAALSSGYNSAATAWLLLVSGAEMDTWEGVGGGIVPEDYLRYFSNKILDIFETWSQRNLSYNVVKLLLWRGM